MRVKRGLHLPRRTTKTAQSNADGDVQGRKHGTLIRYYSPCRTRPPEGMLRVGRQDVWRGPALRRGRNPYVLSVYAYLSFIIEERRRERRSPRPQTEDAFFTRSTGAGGGEGKTRRTNGASPYIWRARKGARTIRRNFPRGRERQYQRAAEGSRGPSIL